MRDNQEVYNYCLAISNPCFEYWLLLHFQPTKKPTKAEACRELLRKEIPNYDKGLDDRKFTVDQINQAITTAKNRDTAQGECWPACTPMTTVYKLAEKILKFA